MALFDAHDFYRRSGGAVLPFILLSAARSRRRPANPLIRLQPASASARAQRRRGACRSATPGAHMTRAARRITVAKSVQRSRRCPARHSCRTSLALNSARLGGPLATRSNTARAGASLIGKRCVEAQTLTHSSGCFINSKSAASPRSWLARSSRNAAIIRPYASFPASASPRLVHSRCSWAAAA